MTARRRGSSSCHYIKEWSSVFSKDRHFNEDKSYVEYKRGIGAVGDDFRLFLQDEEISAPLSWVDEVLEFCQVGSLSALKSGDGLAGNRRDAWLDDRSFPHPNAARAFREYQNPLSAAALYSLLQIPRYGHGENPDANRRLIYIANLSPFYILALAETASFHQISVLRDAIRRYLALQTSIRVRISHRGYSIFQMQFHMSYFVLRTMPTPEEDQQTRERAKPPRQWSDLAFLQIQGSNFAAKGQYGMHETQMSFVLCGPDSRRWVGYAFVDLEPDDEDFPQNNFPYKGQHDDPISLGSRLDANVPIWDPRAYFVIIIEDRMALVLEEWRCLVRTVERSIKRYRSQTSSTISHFSGKTGDQTQEAKRTFDWTQQTIELLNQLLVAISRSIKAWKIFNGPNGDIGYFSEMDLLLSDSPQCRTQQSLNAIDDIFEQLEDLRQTLIYLEKSCRQSAEALQLRLTLEGNQSLLHNGRATELTISILSPIALTIAYFSMPQTVVPFKLDTKSFIISVIIIMAVVRLLFIGLGAWPRWTLLWTRITVWPKKWQLEAVSLGRFMPRRTSGPDATTDGSEMQILDV